MNRSAGSSAIRWFGRVSGAVLVGFVCLFVVGNGGLPNVFAQQVPVQLEFLGLGMIVAGALVGWWCDLIGGVLSLAGFLLFCAVELAVNASMPGGAIPLFCIPGVALILSGLQGRAVTSGMGEEQHQCCDT